MSWGTRKTRRDVRGRARGDDRHLRFRRGRTRRPRAWCRGCSSRVRVRGFFQLVEYGVPEDTLRLAMFCRFRAFFERPLEEKMAAADLKKGYIPAGMRHRRLVSTSVPAAPSQLASTASIPPIRTTLRIHLQARLYFGDTTVGQPPRAPPRRSAAYYKAMEALVARLLRVSPSLQSDGGRFLGCAQCVRPTSAAGDTLPWRARWGRARDGRCRAMAAART